MKMNWKGLMLAGLVVCMSVATPTQAAETQNLSPMHPLDRMKGVWIGEAKGTGPDGKPYQVRQTERVGAMLQGSVLLVEGRGYDTDGKLVFNAFGAISANPKDGDFEIRAYNRGRAGTYKMRVTGNDIVWEVPAGPNAMARYTIQINGDAWHEIGEYLVTGQAPRRITEMTLKRVRDTDWPEAQAVFPE